MVDYGRGYWEVGENLAWGSKWRGSPREVVRAWLNSRPHKRVLLKRGFKHLGTHTRRAGWEFGNPRVRIAVAHFGRP